MQKVHFRLTSVAQKRCCLSSLLRKLQKSNYSKSCQNVCELVLRHRLTDTSNTSGLLNSESIGFSRSTRSYIKSSDETLDIYVEDVDLSKTQSCKYFVYMDRGNPSQD